MKWPLRLLLVTALVAGALWFRSVPFVEVPLLWAAFAVACAPWLAWKHWMVTPLSTLALFAALFLAHRSLTFSVVVHPMRILFLLVAASCIDAWMRRARTNDAGSSGHKATVQPQVIATDSRRLLSTVAKVGYAVVTAVALGFTAPRLEPNLPAFWIWVVVAALLGQPIIRWSPFGAFGLAVALLMGLMYHDAAATTGPTSGYPAIAIAMILAVAAVIHLLGIVLQRARRSAASVPGRP